MAKITLAVVHLALSLSLVTALFFAQTTLVGAAKRCESSRVSFHAAIDNYAIYKHVIRTVNVSSVQECFERCIDDCSCQTFQLYQNTDCELLHEDQHSAPQDFKPRSGYKYYQLIRRYQCPSDSCTDSTCTNKCCESNPCLNGGLCTELCQDPRIKLNCTCPQGYAGKFCTTKMRSCKDYLAADPTIKSGRYGLLDSADRLYTTYCDFGSETGMAWTLIESFSFSNEATFKQKGFLVDWTVNEASFNWASFRLSLNRMHDISNHSTHVRATCNFSPSAGVNYRDYLRLKLSEINPLTFKGEKCVTFEFVSITGSNCSNCSLRIYQRSGSVSQHHLHMDCHYSVARCPGSTPPVPGCTQTGEDLFGYYGFVLPTHGCSSSPSATTQWWFGGKL